MHEMQPNAHESCKWRLFGDGFGNENFSDQTNFSQDNTRTYKSTSLSKLMRDIELEKKAS